MVGKDSNNLEYLSKVFIGLPDEKKDHILNTAKSLFEIQDINTSKHLPKKTAFHKEEIVFSNTMQMEAVV